MEGISLRDLATGQKTEYILVLQTLETVQGVAVIWACVRKFQPLPPDLFRLDGCVRVSLNAPVALTVCAYAGPSHFHPRTAGWFGVC